MSSNTRPVTNVGVGSLREPDEQEFTINEGWDFFQKHAPDNSVMDSEPFNIDASTIEGPGPYRIEIPSYPGRYLNPSSLRLNGTCQIIYKKDNAIQATVPTNAAGFRKPYDSAIGVYPYLPAFDAAAVNVLKTKNVDQLVTEDHIIPIVERITYEEPAAGSASSTPIIKPKYKLVKLQKEIQQYNANVWPLVVPENHMCQVMWKDIEIFMNSQRISKTANLEYALRSRFQTLLSYGPEALDTHMKSEMWYPDDYKEIETMGCLLYTSDAADE